MPILSLYRIKSPILRRSPASVLFGTLSGKWFLLAAGISDDFLGQRGKRGKLYLAGICRNRFCHYGLFRRRSCGNDSSGKRTGQFDNLLLENKNAQYHRREQRLVGHRQLHNGRSRTRNTRACRPLQWSGGAGPRSYPLVGVNRRRGNL